MKFILSTIGTIFMISCTQQPAQLTTIKGSACHVKQLSNGAMIYCDDATFAYVYNGKDGSDGVDGTSCTVESQDSGALITCEDGSSAVVQNGTNGENGADGANGVDGAVGIDGTSCSVADAENGAIITCVEETAAIFNGDDGADGADAVSPVVDILDPCGDMPGKVDEVVLQLENGAYLAFYEHRGDRFLTSLAPGDYTTTDAQECHYKITEDGLLISNSYRGKGKKWQMLS